MRGSPRAAQELALAPTLGELMARADAGLLVVHDAGDARVESVVLHEPGALQRFSPQCLVLAVGYQPGSSLFERLVDEAARAHAVGVVAKPSTAERDALRLLGQQHSISMILAEQRADWLTLASMLRSAAAVSSIGAVAGIRVGDLFAFANAVALATGGATAIVDPAGRLLGFSNLADQPLDELRRRSTLLLAEPDSPARDPDYRRVYASNTCVHIPGQSGTFDRVAIAIRSDREILGSLWVLVPPHQDRQHVERALLQLIESAPVHLHHARADHDLLRSRHAQLLHGVLSGDEGAAISAAALGIENRGWYRLAILFANPSGTSSMSRQQLHSVSTWLDIVHHNALFAELNIQLIVLFSGRQADEWPPIEQSLSSFLHTSDAVRGTLKVATSLAVTRLSELSSEFNRLRTLTRIAARQNSDGPDGPAVIRMEDHWPEVELATIAEAYAKSDARRLSTLTEILEYDRAHQSGYWPTLRAYVLCDRNYNEAASQLHLHANTIRYRIEQLHSKFNLDLTNPETFLWVAIQVHALPAQ